MIESNHSCDGYLAKKAYDGEVRKCICGRKYLYEKKWWIFGDWILIKRTSK